MNIISKYLNKSTNAGFCKLRLFGHIDGPITKVYLKNIYNHLILLFFDEGLINQSEMGREIFIEMLKKLDLTPDKLRELLIKDEVIHHKLLFIISKLDITLACKISGYLFTLLKQYYFINKNIIYIDTDTIYFNGDTYDNYFDSIEIPYEKSYLDSIYFIREKSYIYSDGFNISYFGIKHYEIVNYNHIVSKMKSKIRENKINLILE